MTSKLRIATAGWIVGLTLVLPMGPWGCGSSDNGGGGGGMANLVVQRTDLVSDQAGRAPVTDPNLVNAWGLARSATSPWWVADNHTGVSTLYNGSGQPFPVGQPLVVTVPPPAGSPPGATSAPTGLVFNGTTDFVITNGTTSGPSLFIFSGEDGTLSGWNQTVSVTSAIVTVDNSGDEAIYKGLALAANGSTNLLYATDFHNGKIDVFDKNFTAVPLAGGFSDPSLPADYAPFGVHNINGALYVTYAKQDADREDDVRGAGNGYVDVFSTNGTLMRRFATRGTLNSPWGVALVPDGFNDLGGNLLVGNFGDGRINVFNAANGNLRGQLSNGTSPIVIDGLWALDFGNGGNAGSATTLFFTAGPQEEEHGLFGMLEPM